MESNDFKSFMAWLAVISPFYIIFLYLNPVVGLVFMVVFTPILYWGVKVENKKSAETKQLADYDHSALTLLVLKRSQLFNKHIKICESLNASIAYEPEKITFTSVSIGGITSGSVDKTGGYNYVSSFKKNGLYHIKYDNNFVGYIIFPSELYDEVCNSPIAKYVDKNKKRISVSGCSKERCVEVLAWLSGEKQ